MSETVGTPTAKALPLSRRVRERVAGSFFRASARVVGLRPELIPVHMRQQLAVVGVRDDDLARALRNIRSLGDWPYAWEAEGDRHAADGHWYRAAIAYYVSQRPLLTSTPLKRRLYRLAVDAYTRAPHRVPLEHLRVTSSAGEQIAGYLQVPEVRGGGPVPLLLMLPGVSSTKEELHPFADPLTQRGYAVARLDNPGYGHTTGRIGELAQDNVADVLRHLSADPRLDTEQFHLWGMSMGAHLVLNAAADYTHGPLASVLVVAPAFDSSTFLRNIPTSNIQAVSHMMETDDFDEMLRFAARLSLRGRAQKITAPVRMFHGGRDRTIPVEQAWDLVEHLGGPCALTVFERDHHNCLEHFDVLVSETLEWLRDPEPALTAFARALATRDEEAAPSAGILDRLPLRRLVAQPQESGAAGAEPGLA